MRAVRGLPHAAVLVVAALVACDEAGPPAPTEAAPAPDQRARERAQRMVREADLCESGAAADRAASCRTACDLGHSNSCHVAGELREAAGAPAEALPLYSRACDGGSGLGCEAAARARRAGAGGPRDPGAADRLDRRARFYLRVHCEQRHARSCLVLGRLYATTRGGPAHPGSSATFVRRACSLGLAQACGTP
jgi:uncharacterized protein